MPNEQLTLRRFFERFPDDDACLAHVFAVRFTSPGICSACSRHATFHRVRGRPAFACAHCGRHIYPCAGTILENSKTPLQFWFYAVFLFTVSKNGVSAKELQRTLGVTYKTAWRIGHLIRDAMKKAADRHAETSKDDRAPDSPDKTEKQPVSSKRRRLDRAASHFAASVRATHSQISEKHRHRYLNEFAFRSAHRTTATMFDHLIRAL